MISVKAILIELLGLFIDDGSLAIAALAWLLAAGLAIPFLPLAPAWQAVLLFLGCVAILVENVIRAARRAKP